jgi:glycyl-tRNA synthetase
VREFEQMELEFFVKKGEDEKWHKYWIEERISWWVRQGVNKEKIEILNVPQKELSHYSKATIDLMYEFPHGVEELEGIANRTDFDLGSHSKNQTDLDITADVISNKDSNARLATQNLESKEWEVPYVIEPSAGVDRGVLAILNEAYKEENLENDKNRVVLALKPHLSPIKAAVIPIKKNDSTIVAFSKEIKNKLQKLGLGRVVLENTGNIGKSYRKHDEIGTPICITIDFDTLEDDTVTIRNRDTMDQKRVKVESLGELLTNLLQQ